MKTPTQRHAPSLALVCSLGIGFLIGCAAQESPAPASPSAMQSSTTAEIVESLERASREFEVAQATQDPIAMAQAALDRIEIAKEWLNKEDAAQFIENSIVMIHRARLLASQDEETYETLQGMLADADIGPEMGIADFGRFFGNTRNALRRKRVTTYVIEGQSEQVLHLRVSDDIGVIVYVEAPAYRGVRLRLSDEEGVVHCDDSSELGDLICRFRPSGAGRVTASIVNPGAREVTVLMITNHPIADGILIRD